MRRQAVVFLSWLFLISASGASAAEIALEPFVYRENFETRELRAWASYPLWQDTAYNIDMRVNTLVPGDPNISAVHRVTPFAKTDSYNGMQKILDMYLVPGSSVSFRYYLQADLLSEYLKIRFAAGEYGKVDYTIPSPPVNGWKDVKFTFEDLAAQNPTLAGKKYLKIYAIALLANIPNAVPGTPNYLGLDDVVINGIRNTNFQFAEPKMHKLSEWKPYIPAKHYHAGEKFVLRGAWPLSADKVTLDIVNFTQREKKVHSSALNKTAGNWRTQIPLNIPEGLYLATLKAYSKGGELSDTEFTLFIAPKNLGGKHPRLLFDEEGRKQIIERLKSGRFRGTIERMIATAKEARDRGPLEKVAFIGDQLKDETEMAEGSTGFEFWTGSPNHGPGLINPNSEAYLFAGDKEAGEYTKQLVLKLCAWPYWVHPWYEKRGRHIYYQPAVGGSSIAQAYDYLYPVLTEAERKTIRDALMRNIVIPTHRGYVDDNLITENSSNWIGMLFRGTMSAMIAMYGDDEKLGCLEPYFTGAIFKTWAHISTMGPEGSYGEANNYLMSAMHGPGFYGPSLYLNFGIDISDPVVNVNNERIWAGIVKKRWNFYFGDSGIGMSPAGNFAWFAQHKKDPRLAWFIDHLSGVTSREHPSDSYIFPIEGIPRKDPYGENPVRVFRWDGTTVFKSGWNEDDFVFVMRTGPFFNHQHHDQGSFWLADRGTLFMKERTGSSYYGDPLYQSSFIQPVAHSTILIDHNIQSQRIGDPRNFAPGFDDQAFIRMFLDGANAAYSSGDIGRLYWEKVKILRRNVLYLKPRTLLMLDTALPPEGKDMDVTLLYQADLLKNITPGKDISSISSEGKTLSIHHMYPPDRMIEAVETPRYGRGSSSGQPAEKPGMLTVTARTKGSPLVLANILSTNPTGEIKITSSGDNFTAGTASGIPFAFSTAPGKNYSVEGISTDALAATWTGDSVFAADLTFLSRNGKLLLKSAEPIVCEITPKGIAYDLTVNSAATVGFEKEPREIRINGVKVPFRYDRTARSAQLTLPAGEGRIRF